MEPPLPSDFPPASSPIDLPGIALHYSAVLASPLLLIFPSPSRASPSVLSSPTPPFSLSSFLLSVYPPSCGLPLYLTNLFVLVLYLPPPSPDSSPPLPSLTQHVHTQELPSEPQGSLSPYPPPPEISSTGLSDAALLAAPAGGCCGSLH